MIKFIKENKFEFLVLLLAVLMASIPALRIVDINNSSDLLFHAKRVEGLALAIKNFALPYRINAAANLGYSGADPIMYPHLFVYPIAILYIIFNNFNVAFNIFFILVNIFTPIIMYYSCMSIFNKKGAAFIAALMMTLSFYRVDLIYSAGAMGEYVSMMFIPLVASGYINVMRGNKEKWIDLFIGLFFILQSHIITIFYTGVLLLVISLIFIKKIIFNKIILLTYIKTIVLLLITNLWFVVPFIEYYMSNKLITPGVKFKTDWAISSMMTLQDQFLRIINRFKLLFIINPYVDSHRQLTYMTIFAILFLIIYKIVSIIKKKDIFKDDKNIIICRAFFIIFAFNVVVFLGIFTRCFFAYFLPIQEFFTMQQMEAREVGRGLPLFFMGFAYIFDSVVKNKLIKTISIFTLATIAIFIFYSLLFTWIKNINDIEHFVNGDYLLRGTLAGDTAKMILVNYDYMLPEDVFTGEVIISDENILITNEKRGYLSYSLDYKNLDGNEHTISFPYFNYDGYNVVNKKGKKLNTKSGYFNLVTVNVKNDSDKLKVEFKEPLHWKIFNAVSLLSIILLILYNIRVLNIKKTEVFKKI